MFSTAKKLIVTGFVVAMVVTLGLVVAEAK